MKNILILFTLHLSYSLFAADEKACFYFPPAKGHWEKVDPAKIGWNPAKLREALDYAGKNQSSGLVILYRGRILAEQYWPLNPKEKTTAGQPNPYFHMRFSKNATGSTIEDVASVQKSITAMLVGIAQHKGLLKISDPVHKHLGKGWSKAPAEAEAKIAIRHLITMSSGLNPRLQYVAPAGTKWLYNTSAYSRALSCVSKAAMIDANELTKKWLTKPLGMKDSHWAVRPSRKSVRTDANRYGFATTARDLARFGILMLANGNWEKKNVIEDKAYLKAAISPSTKLNPSYGYLWWLNGGSSVSPKDMYAAKGKLGRRLYVLPTHQLVITRLGDQPSSSFNTEFFKRLRAASNQQKNRGTKTEGQ